MKFTLTIDSENAAVVEDPQDAVSAALRDVAARVAESHESGIIRDYNGNRIGEWEMTHSDEDSE